MRKHVKSHEVQTVYLVESIPLQRSFKGVRILIEAPAVSAWVTNKDMRASHLGGKDETPLPLEYLWAPFVFPWFPERPVEPGARWEETVKVGQFIGVAWGPLFDLKVQDMTRLLDHLHVKNEPMLAVVNMPQWGKVVMVFMFLPPDIWLDFDHQKYQIYLAPDINTMIHFFVARKINSRDTLEIEILVKIIEYLQLHLTNQRVSHTW